jgi:hypothetical protein
MSIFGDLSKATASKLTKMLELRRTLVEDRTLAGLIAKMFKGWLAISVTVVSLISGGSRSIHH